MTSNSLRVPDYVAERIRRRSNLPFVIESSTPVVCFGDITRARAITVGINPSSSEFTKTSNGQRLLLKGEERRLADLVFLSAESTHSLNDQQVQTVWEACLNYFEGPYYKWFVPMQETLLSPLGYSYKLRTAAHLDLIQWATDPLWQQMKKDHPAEAEAHLAADTPFLDRQINDLDVDFIFLSGRPVVESLSQKFSLKSEGRTDVGGGKNQYELFRGKWKDAVVFGTTMNVPDRWTSKAHREFLSEWIRGQIVGKSR